MKTWSHHWLVVFWTRPSVCHTRDPTLVLFPCSCSLFSGGELDTSGKRQHARPTQRVPTLRCWLPLGRRRVACARGPPRAAIDGRLPRSPFPPAKGPRARSHGRRRRRHRRVSPSARCSRPSTRAVRRPAARPDSRTSTRACGHTHTLVGMSLQIRRSSRQRLEFSTLPKARGRVGVRASVSQQTVTLPSVAEARPWHCPAALLMVRQFPGQERDTSSTPRHQACTACHATRPGDDHQLMLHVPRQ